MIEAMSLQLMPETASGFARIALGHVAREYPSKLDHVINRPGDLLEPQVLHPIFYGSFDWHSCVHSHWMLARLLRRFPALPEAQAIRDHLSQRFTRGNVAGELAYLQQPRRAGFARPYGWAWLLALATELIAHDDRTWSTALAPLSDAFAQRFIEYLPKATYPTRAGTHGNSAFALVLVADYSTAFGNEPLAALARRKARGWYAHDADAQGWEPDGDSFLSAALTEAVCMLRCLPADEFARWFDRFLPRFEAGEPAALFEFATVSDRGDGQIAHLDGFNLSRAWTLRQLAAAFSSNDARRDRALETAEKCLQQTLPHLADDYMGEHWLATFATLALDG
jgi:hypothetical protein